MENDYPLIGDRLKNDPRIQEAKKLIDEAVKSHQEELTSIKPAKPELIESYEEILNAFSKIGGGKLYFPYLGSGFGKGPLVELMDGSVKYDMISGIGPHFWGHSFLPLIQEAVDAALSDTIMQGHLQQNVDSYLISDLLVKASGLDHCFLSSSGAMANENGLKLIFQNKFPAQRVLAFDKCFMGRTLGLSQITDKPAYREGLPSTLQVDYIPFYHPDDPEGSCRHTLKVLHHHLARYPRQHACMCLELIQGEGGFNTGTTEFFTAILKVLKESDIRVFVDEIQTYGRTPSLFAFQHFKLDEFVDVVSIGKLSQVCATIFRQHLKPKMGLLSQTFTSSTMALRASRWIIEHLLQDHDYGPNAKIMQLHHRFLEHFHRLEKIMPDKIRGPYGIGAMIAFTPFSGDHHVVAQIVQDLFQAGVISFVAGSNPTKVRFLIPAAVMQIEDVDAVMQIVETVLAQSTCCKEGCIL